MRIKIPCARCGTEFPPKSDVHIYCGEKCRFAALKDNQEENKKNKKEAFPQYRFEKCGHLIQLDFSPHKRPYLLNNLICKECKKYDERNISRVCSLENTGEGDQG